MYLIQHVGEVAFAGVHDDEVRVLGQPLALDLHGVVNVRVRVVAAQDAHHVRPVQLALRANLDLTGELVPVPHELEGDRAHAVAVVGGQVQLARGRRVVGAGH